MHNKFEDKKNDNPLIFVGLKTIGRALKMCLE